jgi:hypothetical protein
MRHEHRGRTDMASRSIDRDKLRVALRNMDREYLLYVLDEAIDLLPNARLHKLVEEFADLDDLRPDPQTRGSLLADVKAFEKASLAGKYYEAFMVNSKNFREKSKGTQTWMAEHKRLLNRCVAAAGKGNPKEVCQAIGILAALLDHIDEYPEDIIFFADEGGSWQVGVDWDKVLPAWFTCLSATTEPDEYARRVVEVIEKYDDYDRRKHLARARKVATPEQRKKLQRAP